MRATRSRSCPSCRGPRPDRPARRAAALGLGRPGRAQHAASRSAVRRCRGHYRLGVLAEPARRDAVLAGLDDRDFAVRRTAMLALGSFPESVVVDACSPRPPSEPRLRRDFLASIDRIGRAAVPVLRAEP